MPNTFSPFDLGLRELALVAHCLPHAELRVHFDDGRSFLVSHHPSGIMTPCAFRIAVSQFRAQAPVARWVGRLVDAQLSAPRCRDLGAGLYAAWCSNVPVVGFTSVLDSDVLCPAVAALPDADAAVRVIPDAELGLSLLTLEPNAPMGYPDLVELAREVQATVLVAELECSLAA